MAIVAEQARHRRAGGFRPLCAALAWLGLAMLLCLPGCGGCRKTPEADEKARLKKEKEKEPFEARPPAVMPAAKDHGGTCKPGHWVSQVWPEVKANRGDFQGELQTEIVDLNDHKVPLLAVRYEMTSQRPVALAKEQPKSLESFTWIPPGPEVRSVDFRLAAGGGGPAVMQGSMSLQRMPSYRYYFVVLSQAAGRYEYLDKKLASIHLHRSASDADGGPKYYEVVSMPAARRPSLPTNALYWTSIAYLLWDDFDPAQWDVDQQQALIDWLHWGGQIIVSGPDALEQLRNSFLRPYLPASVEKSRTFSAADLAELSYWAGEGRPAPQAGETLAGGETEERPARRISSSYGRPAGRAASRPRADRGLGLPPDRTGVDRLGGLRLSCSTPACCGGRHGSSGSTGSRKSCDFAGPTARSNSSRLDAAKMTAVRYFARDTGVEFKDYAPDIVAAQQAAMELGLRRSSDTFHRGSRCQRQSGHERRSLCRMERRRGHPSPVRKAPGWAPGTTSAPWPRQRERRCTMPPASASRSGVSLSGWWSATCACWCRPTGSFSASWAAWSGRGSQPR